MSRLFITLPDPVRRLSTRRAIAVACTCALVPVIAQSQDRLGRDAEAIFEYESATADYRTFDDGPAGPNAPTSGDAVEDTPAQMPDGGPDRTPDAEMAEPVRESVEVGVTPVPAPMEKLRESTERRRGVEPESDPEDAPASRRPAIEYESAFDAYDQFRESEGPDWVGANDTVGEIGGWKTYAREMYESASGDELNDGDQR